MKCLSQRTSGQGYRFSFLKKEFVFAARIVAAPPEIASLTVAPDHLYAAGWTGGGREIPFGGHDQQALLDIFSQFPNHAQELRAVNQVDWVGFGECDRLISEIPGRDKNAFRDAVMGHDYHGTNKCGQIGVEADDAELSKNRS